MKNLKKLGFWSLMAGVLAFNSCTQPLNETVSEAELKSVSIKDVAGNDIGSSVALFAGQTIDAGLLYLDDIDTNGDGQDDVLKVTYELKNNWELVNIHFWIGTALGDMPQTKTGSPKLGNFPYNFDITGNQSTYTFEIPFNVIGFSCGSEGVYMVAAHASIRLPLGGGSYQNETAWGDGLRIVQKGSWAEYFNIQISCDEKPVTAPETRTETAWAYGTGYAKTFSSIFNTPRWGWTNGPLVEGTYKFDLWAAAGKNDLSKGTLVGSVNVSYSAGVAIVKYITNSPYKLEEAQLYVGNDMLAKDNGEYTVAPGQLGNNAGVLNGLSNYTFTVTGLSGSIYVQAHATVSGF